MPPILTDERKTSFFQHCQLISFAFQWFENQPFPELSAHHKHEWMISCHLGLLLVAWYPWAKPWFPPNYAFPIFLPLKESNSDINLPSWIWSFPPLLATLSFFFSSPVQNISVSGLKMFVIVLQKDSLKYSHKSKTRCHFPWIFFQTVRWLPVFFFPSYTPSCNKGRGSIKYITTFQEMFYLDVRSVTLTVAPCSWNRRKSPVCMIKLPTLQI